MQKLLEIPSGEVLSSGLFPGLRGKEPILWVDGENVIFDQGKVRRQQGYVGLESVAAKMTGVKPARVAAAAHLYFGGGGAYYRYRTSDGVTALKSGLAGDGTWIFSPYGEHLVSTDQVNGLRYYDTVDTPIATPFTFARTIFALKQQVFAAGTSNGLNWIEWCDIDNAKTGWTPSPGGEAGNLQPRDLPGGFIASHPFPGDVMGLYTEASLGLFRKVGGTLQWGYKTEVVGIGALGPYSIVPLRNQHFGIMQNRAFVTDGVDFGFIDDPAVKSWLEGHVNWSRASEIFGWHDTLNSTIRWSLPSGNTDTVGLGYRYGSRRWTRFTDGIVLGTEAGAWPNSMLLKAARLVRGDPLERNNDGAAFASYIQTKPLDFGEREAHKLIDKIVLDLTKEGTVNLQVGFSNDPEDVPEWTPTTYVAQRGDNFLNQEEQREGLCLHLRLSSEGVGNYWELGGFSVHGEGGGWKN